MGPIKESALDLTVTDLLTSELKWNKARIEKLLPEFIDQIRCIQPSSLGAQDTVIWNRTKFGVYSTNSGYFIASLSPSDITQTRSNTYFHWIKEVWAGNFSPKMRTFLWAVLKDSLPLGANLHSRGGISASSCMRCQQTETSNHCFFRCPFAKKKVLEHIPLKQTVHIAENASIQEVLVSFQKAVCLLPSGISSNVLPWVLWAIRTSRNTRMFENRTITKEDTALKSLWLAKEWVQAQGKAKESTPYIHTPIDGHDKRRKANKTVNL